MKSKAINHDENPHHHEKINPLPELLCPVFLGDIYIYIHTDTWHVYISMGGSFFSGPKTWKFVENDENCQKTRKNTKNRRKKLKKIGGQKSESLKVDRIYGLILSTVVTFFRGFFDLFSTFFRDFSTFFVIFCVFFVKFWCFLWQKFLKFWKIFATWNKLIKIINKNCVKT